jgi:hypothetical protein
MRISYTPGALIVISLRKAKSSPEPLAFRLEDYPLPRVLRRDPIATPVLRPFTEG